MKFMCFRESVSTRCLFTSLSNPVTQWHIKSCAHLLEGLLPFCVNGGQRTRLPALLLSQLGEEAKYASVDRCRRETVMFRQEPVNLGTVVRGVTQT